MPSPRVCWAGTAQLWRQLPWSCMIEPGPRSRRWSREPTTSWSCRRPPATSRPPSSVRPPLFPLPRIHTCAYTPMPARTPTPVLCQHSPRFSRLQPWAPAQRFSDNWVLGHNHTHVVDLAGCNCCCLFCSLPLARPGLAWLCAMSLSSRTLQQGRSAGHCSTTILLATDAPCSADTATTVACVREVDLLLQGPLTWPAAPGGIRKPSLFFLAAQQTLRSALRRLSRRTALQTET